MGHKAVIGWVFHCPPWRQEGQFTPCVFPKNPLWLVERANTGTELQSPPTANTADAVETLQKWSAFKKVRNRLHRIYAVASETAWNVIRRCPLNTFAAVLNHRSRISGAAPSPLTSVHLWLRQEPVTTRLPSQSTGEFHGSHTQTRGVRQQVKRLTSEAAKVDLVM